MIERAFGVLKRKFKILGSVAEYPQHTQFQLVSALTGLTNFLMAHKDMSLPPDEEGHVNERHGRELRGSTTPDPDVPEFREMAQRREEIATAMWIDYCHHTGRPT